MASLLIKLAFLIPVDKVAMIAPYSAVISPSIDGSKCALAVKAVDGNLVTSGL